MKLLKIDPAHDKPLNQKNLIDRFKDYEKWLVNSIRVSKIETHYYSNIDNSKWRMAKGL